MFVIVLMVAGAVLLAIGAYRLASRRSAALLVGPLAVLLVVGCIGEIADVVGTASRTSDLIGLSILLVAALPVALASSRESRRWLRRDGETMQRSR